MDKENLDEIETYLKQNVSDKGFDFIFISIEKNKDSYLISNMKDEKEIFKEIQRQHSHYLDIWLKNTFITIRN